MAARRQRHEEHEEHVNHERWLITYADMITLLMVLFIVLFAIGQTDLKKFSAFRSGVVHEQNGKGNPVLKGGNGVLTGTPAVIDPVVASPAETALKEKKERIERAKNETGTFHATVDQIKGELAKQGLDASVTFRQEARGLVVTVLSDHVLFESGRADLQPGGTRILDGLATALGQLPNPITIEGHTDDRPVTGLYLTNWELSTSRATSVLRYLIAEHGIAPSRLSAAGYADQRPAFPNDSAEHRAANRRVEIVVVSIVANEPMPTDAGVSETTPTDKPADGTLAATGPSTTQPGGVK